MSKADLQLCKICEAETTELGTATVLSKHRVRYFHCLNCGFVQTEEPYWLPEAYSTAIAKSDIGLVSRNFALYERAKLSILAFFDHRRRFLDYGGGYGLLVRLMRDAGLEFYRDDPYCVNLFAEGFDVTHTDSGDYELVTAFEVFEHLVNPLAGIEAMRRFSPSILFTTVLVPSRLPLPGEWWYYSLETGQHVSIYSIRTLQHIAERLGLNLFTDTKSFHLLTPKRLSRRFFSALQNRWIRLMTSAWLARKLRHRSLLSRDYEQITGHQLC